MINSDEKIAEVKKWLKNLLKVINENASFTFGKVKIINKNRLDDAICCLEASFPEEYKNYIKKSRNHKLKSYTYYQYLLNAIKNKFFLSSGSYSVQYKHAEQMIAAMMSAIGSDIKFLQDESSNNS